MTDHIEVTGKSDVASAFAADRDQIFDRAEWRLAAREAVDFKPEGEKGLLQHIEHRSGRGRHTGAADQLGGEINWVD